MVAEDVVNKILVYLKKQGQTNTFRLASELGIDRTGILDITRRLEEKQAVEVRSGVVRFLKFPKEEKKAIKKLEVKKAPSKQKKEFGYKKTVLETIQVENKRLKERVLELQKAPPKIITRTKVKEVVKRVPVKSKKLKEQAEHIKELEEKIKELQSTPPKIIRRTIVKKVPVKVKEYITKTIIKKVPVKIKEKKPKKEKIRLRKFRLPKINFSGLSKNIKRLNVPEILKKT